MLYGNNTYGSTTLGGIATTSTDISISLSILTISSSYNPVTVSTTGAITVYPNIISLNSSINSPAIKTGLSFTASKLTLSSSPINPSIVIDITNTLSNLILTSSVNDVSVTKGITVNISLLSLISSLYSTTESTSSNLPINILSLSSTPYSVNILGNSLYSPSILSFSSVYNTIGIYGNSNYYPSILSISGETRDVNLLYDYNVVLDSLVLNNTYNNPIVSQNISFLLNKLSLSTSTLPVSITLPKEITLVILKILEYNDLKDKILITEYNEKIEMKIK